MDGLNILGAVYGLRDVTGKCRDLIEFDSLKVTADKTFSDSWLNNNKTLVIVYRYGKTPDHAQVAFVKQNQTMQIKANSKWPRYDLSMEYGKLTILGAVYGLGDVTTKSISLINNNSFIQRGNETFSDTWLQQRKSLVVVSTYDYTRGYSVNIVPGDALMKLKPKITKIVFHVTGFGKFQDVPDNPTTHLIHDLHNEIISDNKDFPPSNVSVDTKILTTSGRVSVEELKLIRKSNDKSAIDTAYVYLHFGVDPNRKELSLETDATNFANFTSPDESGWEPHFEQILKNQNIEHKYHTRLPVEILQATLAKQPQYEYNVKKSVNAGSFVCNFIYYNSLYLSLNKDNEYSMFIHVPMFEQIEQKVQFKFVKDFIIETAKLLKWKYQ